MKVSDIMRVMEGIAPARLAEDWDHVGLQVGDAAADVRRVLVGLSPSLDLLSEAAGRGAQMVICHHPLIFQPLASLTGATPAEKIAAGFVKRDIAFFAAHTNLDNAPGGVNDALAEAVGLADVRALTFATSKLAKVVVFVPEEALEKVSAAICNAGAGRLGAYRDCTFRVPGTGTFTPMEGAHPYIGERGRLERVAEVRLESIVPEEAVPAVVAAIRASHPYEEPAYDVYRLQNERREAGLGRCGVLPRPARAEEFIARAADALHAPGISYAGDGTRLVSKVAVCGGAGGDLYRDALRLGCDLLLTGDVKYHAFLEANDAGIVLADAGHEHTELPGLRKMFHRLKQELGGVDVMMEEEKEMTHRFQR